MMVLGAVACVFLLLLTFNQESFKARNKMLAFIVLMFAGLIFWTLYQMVPMGLTLFIVKKVNTEFWGMAIAPQWIQNINTLVIVFGGPMVSAFFLNLREKGVNISIPRQFTAALFCIGLGYVILPVGIFQAKGGLVSLYWVIACYVLQSIGELLISPVGYAMVGRLAPANLQGVMMGTWMMVTGVAATFSNRFSHLMVLPESASSIAMDQSFSQVFNFLGWGALFASFLLFLASRWVRALMDEEMTQAPAVLALS
jgi:POT family proton-dependent oligopeptide transporter